MSAPLQIPPSEAKPHRGFSLPFLVFLSVLATSGGCLAAHGNGHVNAMYGLLGVVVFPLVIFLVTRATRCGQLVQCYLLLIAGASSCVLAYTSSRVSPSGAFEHVFLAAPPDGVRNLAARKQYFDGYVWLLSFDADEATVDALVAAAKLAPENMTSARSMADIWASGIRTWSGIGHDFLPRDCPTTRGASYKSTAPAPVGKLVFTYLFYDTAAHRAYVVRCD